MKKSTTPEEVSDDSDDELLPDADENSDAKSGAENSESESENKTNELESSSTTLHSHSCSNCETTKPTHADTLRVELSQCVGCVPVLNLDY